MSSLLNPYRDEVDRHAMQTYISNNAWRFLSSHTPRGFASNFCAIAIHNLIERLKSNGLLHPAHTTESFRIATECADDFFQLQLRKHHVSRPDEANLGSTPTVHHGPERQNEMRPNPQGSGAYGGPQG